MNNFFEELKKYFASTSPEKRLKDWSKTAECDNVGPSVENFITDTQQFLFSLDEDNLEYSENIISNFSLEFASGFFYNNFTLTKDAKSYLLNS